MMRALVVGEGVRVPTPTWERLPAARRRAVEEAAEAEFAERGFSAGSLNTIARVAGVAKGSLFQYFADKVDLYTYLSDRASVRIRAAMEPRIAAMPWAEGFFPCLRGLSRVWIAYFYDHPIDLAFTAAVNLEPDRVIRPAVRHVVNRHYQEVLRPLIGAAEQAGHLRPGADLDALLAMLVLLLPHMALAPHVPGLDPVLGLASGDRDEVMAAADRLIDVLENAFAAQPVAARQSRVSP